MNPRKPVEDELAAALPPELGELSTAENPQGEAERPMGAAEPILTELPEEIGEPAAELPLPPPPLPAEQAMLALLVSSGLVKSLWQRAEDAQKRINGEVNSLSLAASLLEQIRQARNQILAGADYFEEADLLISSVEHRLEFQQRVARSSRRIAPWLLVYELVWLALLGAGVALITLGGWSSQIMINAFPTINVGQFINTLIWGGLGGVVGALYALWKHVAEKQDFDPQFSLWYLTNPILGLALGGFVFLIIQAGFFSLTNGMGQEIQSAAIIYVFAWICGFKQNVIYEIVRRILDVFRVNPETKESGGEAKES